MILHLLVIYNTATYTYILYKLRPAEQPSNLHVQCEVTNTRMPPMQLNSMIYKMPHMYVRITYVCGVTAVDT